MNHTDTNTISRVEAFLIESGLMRKWALDGFRRSLPRAVEADGLVIETVREQGNCLRFTIRYPPGRRPSANPNKLRTAVHRMLRRTGWRVRDRSLWMKLGIRFPGVVVCAAPDWRGGD